MSTTKLYVGNLPEGTTAKEMRDLFSSYGDIKELDVIKNYAFVHFVNEDDALAAVKDLHKSKIKENEINVQISKKQGNSRKSSTIPTKVHVGNLPEGCTTDRLYKLFGDREISELDVIKNYAFVHFNKDNDAQSAVREFNNYELDGNVIRVQISKTQAVNRKTLTPPTKVYVGNLPEGCTVKTVRDICSAYGDIAELDVIKNFAFVHFYKEADAHTAVRALDKSKIESSQIHVQISQKQGVNRDNREPLDRSRNFQGPEGSRNLGLGPDRSRNHVPSPSYGSPYGQGLGSAGSVYGQGLSNSSSLFSSQILPNVPSVLSTPNQAPAVVMNEDKEFSNGFVITEKCYVDPGHPLMKGLPYPKLPKLSDHFMTGPYTDPYAALSQAAVGFNSSYQNSGLSYRDRSPVRR